MIGLKRGTVKLLPHQEAWSQNAEKIIGILKQLLGNIAVDIQHVGSTAVVAIQAKPIIDIAAGVWDLSEVLPYIETLEQHGFIFRGEDVPGQLLFVMGDFENDTRTHHIHVVKWNSTAWNNYINFRDYLNAHPEKAMNYDVCKQRLALQFPNDRNRYTSGKQKLIECLLIEAGAWKSQAQ